MRIAWKFVVVSLLVSWDVCSLWTALSWMTPGALTALQNPWIAAYAAALAIILIVDRAYTPRGSISRVSETFKVVRALAVVTVVLVVAESIMSLQLPTGPRNMVKASLIFGAMSIPFRWGVRSVQKYLFRYGIGTRRTLLVGSPDRAAEILRQIRENPELGFEVAGFISDVRGGTIPAVRTLAYGLEQVGQQVAAIQPEEVVLALPQAHHDELLNLLTHVNGAPVSVQIMSDMYDYVVGLARTEQIYGLPLLRLNPEIMSPWMRAVKRGGDVAMALVVSLLSLPLMLVIALLVKLTSPGPVIFSQERVGLKGRLFIMHKFRSMWKDAEQQSGPVWASPDDPRVTPLGRFLRRFRLDELPQFWNVFKGDMSIVGPRPERQHFVDLLGEELAYYRRRLAVRPGLTGWAQVRGSYDNSLEDVRLKLKDDLYYIENGSLQLDLKILLLTLRVLVSGRGQ